MEIFAHTTSGSRVESIDVAEVFAWVCYIRSFGGGFEEGVKSGEVHPCLWMGGKQLMHVEGYVGDHGAETAVVKVY